MQQLIVLFIPSYTLYQYCTCSRHLLDCSTLLHDNLTFAFLLRWVIKGHYGPLVQVSNAPLQLTNMNLRKWEWIEKYKILQPWPSDLKLNRDCPLLMLSIILSLHLYSEVLIWRFRFFRPKLIKFHQNITVGSREVNYVNCSWKDDGWEAIFFGQFS